MISLPERYRGAPLLVVASVFFALMALFARMLSGRMPSHEVVMLRFLIGIACMGGYYLRVRRWPDVPRPLAWALRGIFGGGAVFFYFVAIDKMEVGPATVLNYSSPIYAGVIAAFFLDEPLSFNLLLGILIAAAGSLLVATASGGAHLSLGVGAAAGLFSALLAGAATAVIRALRNGGTSSGSIFTSFCLFGALWALPFCFREWVALDRVTLALALSVGLTSVIAQLLFSYSFKYISAARGGAVNQLTSAFTWLLGVMVLHESLQPRALLGAAICVGGVLLSSLAVPRPAAGEQPQTAG